MRLLPVLLASIGALGATAACSPARAQWDDNDGWRRHEWREHEWREHDWRERQRQSYAPPPVIYAPPPLAYSYAPPAYYAPPPAAYYAPPPPLYQNPGVSIGFGFGFR
jgi:hypothetical protein